MIARANEPDECLIELPPLAGYQLDAIFCPERWAIIEATTKAGKTIACIWWIVDGACNHGGKGYEFWWVAPINDQTRIAYDRMVRMWIGIDPQQRYWSTNKTEKSITLRNGSVIRFKSADEPNSLYGEDVHRCVMDEASRAKEEAWFAVRSTLTATRGACRIIGNVNGRHNWAYTLSRRVEGGSLPGWRYAKITCYDAVKAGIITAAEVEEAKAVLPEHVFKELYEGIPSEDGHNPFGLSHIAACVGPLSDQPVAAFGVDLAKSQDWTVAIGLDENGRAVSVDRWQHLPWEETTRRIGGIVGDMPALIDSTGVGDPVVEAIQLRCPQVEGYKFTSTSKQQLMEGLSVAIQSMNIRFPDGIVRTELETFEYEPTRTGVRYTAPAGLHDDCVCALALAYRQLSTRCNPTASWDIPKPTRSLLTTAGRVDFDAAKEREAYFFPD